MMSNSFSESFSLYDDPAKRNGNKYIIPGVSKLHNCASILYDVTDRSVHNILSYKHKISHSHKCCYSY
jgi:hypothetical protein